MQHIQSRKDEHLELCATREVGFRSRGTLLDNVRLVHQALPELHLDEVDLSVEILGKRLRAPLIIAGMTGGTPRAGRINQALATVAEACGYGFGLGSQRAMQDMGGAEISYQVRQWAPTTLILGNIGVMQARDMSSSAIQQLVGQVGADALCVHMNPAMELIQQEGDRDFSGGLSTFTRLAAELPIAVVAKETGCGISKDVALALKAAGVRAIDVSGAGGTSWVGVETLRAGEETQALGELLWDWGIPTAVSVAWCAEVGIPSIATGGIRHGLDIAAALSLGACAVGIAGPVLKALEQGGQERVRRFLSRIEQQLRAIMLLSGVRTVAELRARPRVITGELKDWLTPSTLPTR
ncbi:MAG: type 2 isopentenyl-diphosphate Delta-isomerase [Myxococcales bacterium]|nr:type 2 isopentenyl-diphosphate Delta-isomerase [Myxococcales bacterium]MCB9707429.1 type 2 isopentenyl-diphosphate Delta-isomerase [Myxococcales bacterium]